MLRLVTTSVLALSFLGGATLPEAWHWWRGEDAFHQEKYAEAAERFAKGWEAGSGGIQSRIAFNEGDALYRAENWEGAEGAFARAIQADPTHWEAYYNQANAQVQQGYVDGQIIDRPLLERALASYESALEIEPTDEDTIHNHAWLKKLLEEEPPQQQQNQEKDEENDSESEQENQDQKNQDQNQDNSGDQEQESNADQQKGDQEQDSESGQDQEDQDNGGDQEQNQQGGSGGDPQEQDGSQEPRPDLTYSDQVLDRLAQEEAMNQHYRSMQRQQMGDDPLQELLNQLMQDPGNLIFGGGGERRKSNPNDVDW